MTLSPFDLHIIRQKVEPRVLILTVVSRSLPTRWKETIHSQRSALFGLAYATIAFLSNSLVTGASCLLILTLIRLPLA